MHARQLRLTGLCARAWARVARVLCAACCRGRTVPELVKHYYATKHRAYVPPSAGAPSLADVSVGGACAAAAKPFRAALSNAHAHARPLALGRAHSTPPATDSTTQRVLFDTLQHVQGLSIPAATTAALEDERLLH